MELEIEYDHCWFLRHPKSGKIIQAPTIRALLVKLGSGYTIKGYFPNGNFQPEPWPKEKRPPRPRMEHKRSATQAAFDQMKKEMLQPTPWLPGQKEQAITLAKENYTGSQIAMMLGKTRNQIIGIVNRARKS